LGSTKKICGLLPPVSAGWAEASLESIPLGTFRFVQGG